MKKFSWIMALLAALALVFVGVGCPTGGTEEEPEGEKEFTLELADNYQYGHGYQGLIDALDYFSGKITKGDEFTISFKVKASRDLEDTLNFGLVDPSAAASYWTPLTWDADNDEDPTLAGPDKPGPFIKKDEEKTVTVEWKAIASATSSSKDANKLVFMTSGKSKSTGCDSNCDWKKPHSGGAIGDGEKGAVTLTFTDFELKRKGEAGVETCPTCKKPIDECTCPGEPFKLSDVLKTLTAGPIESADIGKTLGSNFVNGGDIELEVTADKKLQMKVLVNWGGGLDLKAGRTSFKLAAGDKITVTGTIVTLGEATAGYDTPEVKLAVGVDAYPDAVFTKPIGGISNATTDDDDAISLVYTITADDVTNLTTAAGDNGAAPSVRISARSTDSIIIISEIEIERAE